MKQKFLKILLLATASATCLTIPTHPVMAGGIPVFDGVAVGHAITQLNEMAKDYQAQLDQLDQALDTYNSITGARGIGDLLNSTAEQDLRHALPDNLQSMIGINNASGLSVAGLQTQGIYNDILTTYAPIKGSELFKSDPSGTLATAHDKKTDTAIAALAASESAYNAAAQRLQGYETLLSELSSSPDLKSSVDLLARISVENGILMNELMKMQSLQMQLNASQQAQEITASQRLNTARTYNEIEAAKAFETNANQ